MLCLAVGALLLISGCASVTRGTKDTLVVESVPTGATVRLSTGGMGTTPTSFQLPRKEALDVFIEKEGYEPLVVHVSSQISGAGAVGMAGNVLIGGLVGIGVDTWTGATKDLRPNPVKVTLNPRKVEAKPSQDAGQGAAVAKREDTPAASPGVGTGGALADGRAPNPPPVDFKPTGVEVGTVRVPTRIDPGRVQDVICGALLGRDWDVTEKASGHVVGHINHHSSEAVLTLVFDSEMIQMYCEGWKIDQKTGARIRPKLPDGWIQNIRKDLNERLSRESTAPGSVPTG